MAKSRLELSKVLHTLCEHVYYQPPTNTKIEYPCILYEKASGLRLNADNRKYLGFNSYTITVIDKNPDSELPNKVDEAFEMCTMERHYVYDNLNHDVFLIYF